LRVSPFATGQFQVFWVALVKKVNGLISESGESTFVLASAVAPIGMLATSDMLVSIQLAIYIWQEAGPFVSEMPPDAMSSCISKTPELCMAIGRVCGRYQKPVPMIVTVSGGGVGLENASDWFVNA
jgi:hypothetical protein